MDDDDPALSLGREPPLFYLVLVIALASLAGTSVRHLRDARTGEPAVRSGEPAELEATATDLLPETDQRLVVRVASDGPRVHRK